MFGAHRERFGPKRQSGARRMKGVDADLFTVRDPDRPLSGANLLHVEVHPKGASGQRLLTVEALLPRRGVEDSPEYLETVREDLLASLGEFVPFLGEHVILVDSPHDDRPALDTREGRVIEPGAKWGRGPRTMDMVYGYPITSTFGVAALPVRTPVRNLLLLNQQVVPGLGAEGALFAAWAVARLIASAGP